MFCMCHSGWKKNKLQCYLRQQRELHDWQPKLGELHDEQLHDRYPEQQPRAEEYNVR